MISSWCHCIFITIVVDLQQSILCSTWSIYGNTSICYSRDWSPTRVPYSIVICLVQYPSRCLLLKMFTTWSIANFIYQTVSLPAIRSTSTWCTGPDCSHYKGDRSLNTDLLFQWMSVHCSMVYRSSFITYLPLLTERWETNCYWKN